jgi:hypothetical protein
MTRPGCLSALAEAGTVFAVGWILGPFREHWAVPHFGRMAAMLSEAVIMLIAMTVAAQATARARASGSLLMQISPCVAG